MKVIEDINTSLKAKIWNTHDNENTNVESKTRSVVKYVINNITSTSLTGQSEDGYVLVFCAQVTV